ncbi:ATP-binding protein [Allokutzneria sp. A3M-2-11 16]|uniref:ATP-binding protein n=1 Tax=Allokutzneria sp. A3M-2-11 16 TaxID=2962043 RepID=UPI0020B68733|nr:ATP-binding protein [Allokutzneria sp. A3M-2-11 16]MCP3803948.1 ATP-binding protein [Allokutzneria sp. A3M-2-11 16]
MNSDTAQVDDLQLIALPSAVNCTDLFVRFTLSEWSLRPMVEETSRAACQLVAEKVDDADPKAPGLVTVRLLVSGDRLVVEVDDGRLVAHALPLPAGLTGSSVPLPRRERKRSRAAERIAAEQPVDDGADIGHEVMQRILYGLNNREQD